MLTVTISMIILKAELEIENVNKLEPISLSLSLTRIITPPFGAVFCPLVSIKLLLSQEENLTFQTFIDSCMCNKNGIEVMLSMFSLFVHFPSHPKSIYRKH